MSEDYAEQAREIKENIGTDIRVVHLELDKLLCKALREHGEDELVEEFKDQKKWYE